MADETTGVETSTQDSATPETTPDATSGSQTTPPASTGPAPAQNAADDRNKGILADLQKERKARQQYEQQANQWKSQYEQEQRRVQALAGVNPRSAEEDEVDAVRQRLRQVEPWMAKLDDAKVEKLLAMLEQADSLSEATNHHWQTHGKQMLNSVVSAVSKQLGGTLTERQATRIKQAYAQEAESNPEFLQRHEAGDPTLVDEFVKIWNEDFFEPARRKAVASEVNRMRGVPSGRDRSIASTGGKKLDYNNPKAVEDALVASFKEHGGAFGE